MIDINEINSLISKANTLADTTSINKCLDKLALELTRVYQSKNPVCLVVMKGGLVFAGHLLPKLNFLLQVEYCHPSRYGQHSQGGELVWKVQPPDDIKDREVLILDDIYDEGHTLAGLVEKCKALGAKTVGVAVLISKKHTRKIPVDVSSFYCGFEVPDTFVFGFGLDYKGYFRNCNCIYESGKTELN